MNLMRSTLTRGGLVADALDSRSKGVYTLTSAYLFPILFFINFFRTDKENLVEIKRFSSLRSFHLNSFIKPNV